ncbi:MAG: histidine phosphatase family protein [Verrucomicrobia bacterium]|nr:histidine phosphatase family protein [Verrucomicrobiota bacterium]
MARTVWITRHGNRQDFVDPTWSARAERPHDPDLSEDGIVQARELGRRLAGEHISHIIASPFLRTMHTAHHVAEALDLPIYLEHGLSEWINGEWFEAWPELLSAEERKTRFPAIDNGYRSCVMPVYPETGEEALKRSGEALRHLLDELEGDLLIVGHGASVIGTAWSLIAGRPEIIVHFCTLVKIVQKNGRWVMELKGDTSHLTNVEGDVKFC